jgi:branched-subunit amino acid ABC-type transport system permease component
MAAAFVIPAAEIFVAGAMIDILKIQNISTNYSINLVLILTGFMMFVLGGIFKYGSYLQHEYDETV